MRSVSTSPAWSPARLPRLIDCSAQCIVKLDVTRIAVLTPATKTGKWNGASGQCLGVGVDDADEEVGGEERAEEHRLRGDEEEHAEHRRRRPASSGSRSAARGACASAWALMPRPPTAAGSTTTCSTGNLRLARAAARRGRAAARTRAARERGDDDLVDALVLDRLHRRGERIRVRDLAVGLDPLRAEPRQRLPQPPLRLGMLALRRIALRADDEEAAPRSRAPARGCGRAAARRARSRSRPRARSPRPCAPPRRRRRARPGGRRRPCGSRRGGSAAASPTSPPGASRRSARPTSSSASTSFTASSGSSSTTWPVRGDPRLAKRVERAVEPAAGRGAARVVVDDVALARLVHGRDHDHERDRLPSARCRTRVDRARRRRASRSRRRGRLRCRALTCTTSSSCSRRGAASQHRVPRAGDAVLVRAADDLRDLVEVEDRRRRGDLPLERHRAPRVRRRRSGRAPS